MHLHAFHLLSLLALLALHRVRDSNSLLNRLACGYLCFDDLGTGHALRERHYFLSLALALAATPGRLGAPWAPEATAIALRT